MEATHKVYLPIAWILLTLFVLGGRSLLCNQSGAYQCHQDAFNNATKTACNWNVVVPMLEACIVHNTEGCHTREQEIWLSWVRTFNQSVQYGNQDSINRCATSCAQNSYKMKAVQNCSLTYGTVKDLTALIVRTPQSSVSSSCIMLQQLVDCMYLAAKSCQELTNQVTQILAAAPDWTSARQKCNTKLPTNQAITTPNDTSMVGVMSTKDFIILMAVLAVIILIISILVIICYRNKQERIRRKDSCSYEETNMQPMSGVHFPGYRYVAQPVLSQSYY